jgi:hypothetical protein
VKDGKDDLHHSRVDDATRAVENSGESFIYNLAQKPVNAIVQEVNHLAQRKLLPDIELVSPLPDAPEGSAAEKAQKAGELMAVVPWVLVGNRVLRQVGCLSGAELVPSSLRAAIAGGSYGAFLQPVDPTEGNFASSKLKNTLKIAVGVVTARAAFAGMQEGLAAKSDFVRYEGNQDYTWDIPDGGTVARDLNAARRARDMADGIVPTVKDSHIFDELANDKKWQLFRSRSNKELLIDKSKGIVAKVFNADELADQAAALKKIQTEFGVTVPQNLVLHTAEDKAALTMTYVEHKTGQDVYVLANSPPGFGVRNRQSDYIDLYKQGESLAYQIHHKLNKDLFFSDMHDENWGFTAKTIRNWKEGMTLEPKDLVVTDPVRRWVPTRSRFE